VNGLPDPLVELYDPEDFLIAANDDYRGRGKNSALTVTLPATAVQLGTPINRDSTEAFPNPSTYRIVVMGADGKSEPPSSVEGGNAYIRKVNGGNYELKVFTGSIVEKLSISDISPNMAVQGLTDLEIIINGNKFADGATVNFSGTGITTKTVNFINSNQLKATLDISSTAPAGFYDITITNADGGSVKLTNAFEIKTSLGKMVLSWDAPAAGGLNPPSNLTGLYNGEQKVEGSGYFKQNSVKTSSVFLKKLSFLKGNQGSSSVLTEINEIEPNNNLYFPQILTGSSPLIVLGNAEAADTGEVSFAGVREQDDDIEDLYLVTTTAPGLSINLSGYYSDCDLFLIPLDSMLPPLVSAARPPGDLRKAEPHGDAEDVAARLHEQRRCDRGVDPARKRDRDIRHRGRLLSCCGDPRR
jgi:hypothetical protein